MEMGRETKKIQFGDSPYRNGVCSNLGINIYTFMPFGLTNGPAPFIMMSNAPYNNAQVQAPLDIIDHAGAVIMAQIVTLGN
jgi:hypothetical protein